jgi:hypothetical protein
VAHFGKEDPREQHNYGSGTFIGGNMHGDIRFETLDPKTKSVLEKLSKDAPGLAELMEEALRDGVISPDAVAALQSAVRNINEDVASALLYAGRNINEDVAESLRLAGKNINEGVAGQILQAAETLDENRRELDSTLHSLNAVINKINGRNGPGNPIELMGTITYPAEPTEYTATPFISRIATWWATAKVLALGIAIGALVMFILIRAHVRPF